MNALEDLVVSWHQGQPRGIYSVCSAHPWVLEAAVDQALEDGSHLLVEATSNQVNHQGGYTGMQPADFSALVTRIAGAKGFDTSRLILGGDHLGPNPWQKLAAAEAMREAARMVQAYARAGFRKLHLDASMACGDEQGPLTDEVIAARAAELCAAAEEASTDVKPVYVIGTEVPVPGGATASHAHVQPTTREAAAKTLDVHRKIFAEKGLGQVWPRIIALVVQPGVEFNHDSVIEYEPAAVLHLVDFLRESPGIVYEAHSTDYQRAEAYRNLVRDGFAILKVGPALTFAMREALQALSQIEAELVQTEKRSRLMDVIEQVMLQDPRYWQHYYTGNEDAKRLQRRYSYSDRVRYYWGNPEVKKAVETLLDNLRAVAVPETMLSAYLPEVYRAVCDGNLRSDPRSMVIERIRIVLRTYAAACGNQESLHIRRE